ncbi:hypothetical protein ABZ078_43005 [Streptomyces sp. NPDC006385]|uniref:hypothetical protein n=1 Tax=Streptomyces sp. NPDC006385 TaxID=3156761 RepID=UPI00339F316D
MNDDRHSAERQPVRYRLARLRQSAQRWLKGQLAVLAALALFAVLKSGTKSSAPFAVQWMSGALFLLAVVVVCWAAYLVSRAAWSVPSENTPSRVPPGDADMLSQADRRLRRGLLLTYVAMGLAALSTTSLWWPSPT